MLAAKIRGAGFAVVAMLALGVGCGTALAELQPPAGSGPLRYRDAVFSALTKTPALIYGSAPDASGNPVTLTLDMYRPNGDTQTSRPAIVLVHGGGYVSGNSHNGAMVKMATAFATSGYVAVSINYRLLGQKGEKCGSENPPSATCVNAVLAAQHDAQAAIRWLRANHTRYGVDPTRIAIGGGSAGAGTALAVAVNSGDPGDSGNPGYSSKVGAAISISAELPDAVASTYFDPSDSPILMFNGTADPVVPYQMAVQTVDDLKAAGVPVVFEPLLGAGHVPFKTEGTLMISQSLYFSYDTLDLADAAGQPTASPTAAISSPANGAAVILGATVPTRFTCAEGNAGPGLLSCADSGGARSPSGHLDTSTPGTHTYTVTAVSWDGRTGRASITFTVKRPAPALSRLRIAPQRFRAARSGGSVLRRRGMAISYRDTLAARTTLTVERRVAGVRRGGRCTARPRAHHASLTPCTRTVRVGSFSHDDRPGVSRLHFSGRLHDRALAPGSYVLKLSAVLAGRRSRTLSASFRILAPRPLS